ncbi:MAG: 30S ribosomal protein S6 [Planctomycetia bacterium]|nr:30S ribosomal protein S6 [Planctomycetia bacterium]
MALNVYEGLFILDSSRFSRDPDNVSGQVTKLIQDAGGEILVSRLWEERRLAYPIEGQRKGVYWLTYFRLDSLKLAELNRQFGLYDANLRNLFIKIDARIVDAMVEHALAGPAAMQDRSLPEVEEDVEESDFESEETEQA